MQPEPFPSALLAKQPGFSLHAATCCEANQREKLKKLCRYITRPAVANRRLSTNERGQVIHTFKQPFRDGTTHVVLDPLDFIARLAALVPRPRLNLTRFHECSRPTANIVGLSCRAAMPAKRNRLWMEMDGQLYVQISS